MSHDVSCLRALRVQGDLSEAFFGKRACQTQGLKAQVDRRSKWEGSGHSPWLRPPWLGRTPWPVRFGQNKARSRSASLVPVVTTLKTVLKNCPRFGICAKMPKDAPKDAPKDPMGFCEAR